MRWTQRPQKKEQTGGRREANQRALTNYLISTGPSSGKGSTAIVRSGNCLPGVTSASLPSATRTRRLSASSTTIAAAAAATAMRVPANDATPPQTMLPSARLACVETRFVDTARARTHAGAAPCVPADRLARTVTQAVPAAQAPTIATASSEVDATINVAPAHSRTPDVTTVV